MSVSFDQGVLLLEKSLQSPLDCKEIQPVHPKRNQSWRFIGRTDTEAEAPILWSIWCKELTHWKRCWCWERLKVGGEGDDRGWDGWMASLTRWTGVWVNSGSWWWQASLPCCSPWGLKESNTTERLNWLTNIYAQIWKMFMAVLFITENWKLFIY